MMCLYVLKHVTAMHFMEKLAISLELVSKIVGCTPSTMNEDYYLGLEIIILKYSQLWKENSFSNVKTLQYEQELELLLCCLSTNV